jgi:ascorbate-specific PTS system EIIC-type component UlaA
MVEKGGNFNLEKSALLVVPLFYSSADFGVFNPKVWGFRARVLILRP